MYKLIYEYHCCGDKYGSPIGYFDNETDAIAAWNRTFNDDDSYKDGLSYGFDKMVDRINKVYTFSCCGWREWFRLEEFEYIGNGLGKSRGGFPCTLNKVDFTIKEAVKTLADKNAQLYSSSINYEQVK